METVDIQSICIKKYSNSLQEKKKSTKQLGVQYWFIALSSKALKLYYMAGLLTYSRF
jgi:hypothetical protein